MLSRIEKILENMLGAEHEILPPMSRNETLLIQILEQVISGGGESAVDDVQINSTSIVTDGVANVPVVTPNGNYGVIKLGANAGVSGLWSDGQTGILYVVCSTSAQIKQGDNRFNAITPLRQHESTFYGLAKAAGHDENNSTLALGTYTDEAKVAIQKMLGIYEAPFELINTITTTDGQTEIYIATDESNSPFDLTEVIIDIDMPKPTDNGHGILIINEASKPSNLSMLYDSIPNILCRNLFNSGGNRRNIEHLKIIGGRFFGYSQDGAMTGYTATGSVNQSIASSGIIEVDKIRSLLLCSANNFVFPTGTVITVYGR